MRYVVVGDLHLKPNILHYADKLFKILEKLGLPVIFLGDLLDTKEIIRGSCLNKLFDLLKNSKLEYIILVGNHDLFNLDTTEHSLKVLEALPNVIIVDDFHQIKNAYFFPFTNNTQELKVKISKLKTNKTLFLHQGVIGFDYGNGYIADGKGSGELNSEAFKGFKVISGHFHKFAEKGKITFLGTPWTNNWGESNNEGRLAIWNSETQKIEEFIPMNFPKHRTFYIKANENLEIKENGEDFIRVVLEGSEEEVKVFDKSRFPNVKFIEKIDNISYEDTIEETSDNISKFTTWGKDIAKISDSLLKKGIDILKEVE